VNDIAENTRWKLDRNVSYIPEVFLMSWGNHENNLNKQVGSGPQVCSLLTGLWIYGRELELLPYLRAINCLHTLVPNLLLFLKSSRSCVRHHILLLIFLPSPFASVSYSWKASFKKVLYSWNMSNLWLFCLEYCFEKSSSLLIVEKILH